MHKGKEEVHYVLCPAPGGENVPRTGMRNFELLIGSLCQFVKR